MNLREEMESLNQLVLKMSDAVVTNITEAINYYLEKCDHVEINDDLIDQYERLVEEMCVNILLKERPFAKDLKEVTGVLKLVSDLERIGDHAEDIYDFATKLIGYKEKEEKNALRIGRYFRSDYIGKELLKNFFLASIGYILVLAVAVLYHIEWLVDEIDTIDLQFAAGCLIASYLCFLAVYSIVVYVISTIRYQGAQKKLKWYGKELDDLQNMYEEQEKSGKKSGRRRKET